MEGRDPMKVVCVFPEPTPYRASLLDRLAARDDVDLRVVYAALTVVRRSWTVELGHPAEFLQGVSIPGMRRIVRHDYPVTPGIWRLLSRHSPDVVVISGWSMFASQAAILWCKRHRVPYVEVVESHDIDRRPTWRLLIRNAVVPRVLGHASAVLVTGTLARNAVIRSGVPGDRISIFANTVDTAEFANRAEVLSPRRAELRRRLGIDDDELMVLCVSRLAHEKALDVLLRAVADLPGVVPVLAGEGPERAALEELANDLGVRVVFAGDVPWHRIVELYVAADVFALISKRETWGVVVNEAAACGLPLLLSDRVGAAADLVEENGNGIVVPADDVAATKAALATLRDPELRARFGRRSAEIARAWDYVPSIDGFLTAVRVAHKGKAIGS